MHQEDNEELNDEEFKEALLVAAQSGDNRFDTTESEDISLASVHSEESLGGAHFQVILPKEHINKKGTCDARLDPPRRVVLVNFHHHFI